MSSRRQYPFDLIEPKWQRAWDAEQTFRAFNPGDSVPAGHPFGARYSLAGKTASAAALPPKFYILDMFPYPSGAGLHVGHPEGYTATDILARYRRAKGFNVLHPMGWDSFGLPAEQYAVKTGQHPRVTTEQNIANFTRQIKSLGFSYDWSCELATTDPEYFRWTQWIFLQLYNSYFDWHWNKATPIALLEDALSDNPTRRHEWQDNPFLAGTHDGYVNGDRAGREEARRRLIEKMRLAYVSEQPVWWCEELGTVLANEEVVDGKSEVGGFPVVRKPMRQWVLRITAYAERLLDDLNTIEWTDSLKEMQRNWIGRSEGAEVDFAIADCRLPIADSKIRVFTTRPDTLFGATYMVLAPEHKLVDHIVPESWPSGTPDAWKGQRKYQPAITAVEATEPGQIAFGMAKVDLTGLVPTPAALQVMTAERALRFRAVPIYYGEGTLIVAISNPADLDMMDSLRHELSVENLEFRVASESDIERILVEFYGAKPSIALSPREAVAAYRTYASGKSDLERTELAKEKTGVFTGAYAINPVNGEKIPIWIADYVLASYGTGAIMAVPAHDERDWEFAQKFGLTIKPVVGSLVPKVRDAGTTNRDEHLRMVVAGKETYVIAFGDCFVGEGIAINSANAELSLHGLPTAEAKAKITAWLEAKGLGKKTINYKLRDWLFSRQRYWGEPFPIVWRRDASGQPYHEALPESALPLLPPALTDYKPTASGEPPLARAKDWVNLPDGAVREVNTMPQWAGSCWYYLRYLDSKNGTAFVSKEAESYWMGAAIGHRPSAIPADGQAAIANGQAKTTPGVDLYVGGTEHAVLHLLYARFWHKVLFDLGHVSTAEPFYKLVNQGLILGEDGQKMSKSRGNVVNPDDVLVEFGADAFRLYEMFMGPLQDTKPWNTRGVEGVYRFLGRVWRLFIEEKSETAFEQAQTVATQPDADLLDHLVMNATISDVVATPAQLKVLHACIKKVTEDLDHLRFNTAISAMMVFVNEANGWQTRPFAVMRTFLQLLAPFAPHLTEELWSRLHSAFGQRAPSLSYAAWPSYDPALLVESEVEVPVSVNGKLRDVIRIAVGADESAHEAAARAAEKVKPLLEGKTVKKVIVKPGKMVNLVVG